MEWMLMPLRRYAEFHGRSRRMEYWMFQLFMVLVYSAMAALILVIAAISGDDNAAAGGLMVVIIVLVALGLFIPALAVTVRRLHDQGKSGWWYLINFIPLGSLVILVFMFLEGDRGPNEYGPDPKGGAGDPETFA